MGTTFTIEEWTESTDLDPIYKWVLRWEGEDFLRAMDEFRNLFNDGKVIKLTGRNN